MPARPRAVRELRTRSTDRTKQLHLALTLGEKRKLNTVAIAEHRSISALIRMILMPEIDRRYQSLQAAGNGNGNGHQQRRSKG